MLIIRIRLGVENRKTKFPNELIFLYFIKLIIKKKSSLKNNPCTSETSNDSADEKLQLKTIHQTNNTESPKNLVLEIVYKGLTGNSLTVTKTSIFTASPFLLELYRTYPNLYIDEKTRMLLQKI